MAQPSVWYRKGTISVSAGSKTVSGKATKWSDPKMGVGAGQMLLVPGAGTVQMYEIVSVDSDTQLTLNDAWVGQELSDSAYAIPTGLIGLKETLVLSTVARLGYYQAQMDNWQKIMTEDGDVTIELPDGTTVVMKSFKALSGVLESKLDKTKNLSDLTDKAAARKNMGWTEGYLPLSLGGLGAGDAAGGRNTLGLGDSATRNIGTASGTVAAGDDNRLNTVNGKAGGSITSGISVSGSVKGAPAAGVGVVAGEANQVELNNSASGGPPGNYVGWTVYRWYEEMVLTGISRAGDATIQSYFISMTNVGVWSFDRSGNASGPGSWVNGSDIRHKSKITVVSDPLASVLTWRGATYNKKDGITEVGLIAQDVEKSCPAAVTTSGERKFNDGTVIPDFKYLNTSGVAAAYHTEAIKTLFELVELLAQDKPEVLARVDKIKMSAEEISERTVEHRTESRKR